MSILLSNLNEAKANLKVQKTGHGELACIPKFRLASDPKR